MSKTRFWILSLTWGLPATFIGAIVMLVLMIFGKRPKRCGYCFYVEIGEDWGGLEFGMFFLVQKKASIKLMCHEYGHGLQNCYWGPFMLLISGMSVIRYWYREIRDRIGIGNKTEYDDIWFEGQATNWGLREWVRFKTRGDI